MHKDNFMKKIKIIAKFFIPEFILNIRRQLISSKATREFNKNSDLRFSNKSPREVFTTIYREKLWGKDTPDDYYSGSGSHDEATLKAYVSAIQSFLRGLTYKPNVVDLGCGDFNVGMQFREMCNQYIACDVVSGLIERNKVFHKDLNVDFRCLDMCDDTLPSGDVVFIRQVFQHLTNQQILSVVRKLSAYKFLILTEGLPATNNFIANCDKPIGDGVRFQREVSGGVVLTLPPFNLAHKSEAVLCEVPCGAAVIRTTVYQLQ